jgi:hypothetical protein
MFAQLKMGLFCALLAVMVGSADRVEAAPAAVGVDGPGGGELVPVRPMPSPQDQGSEFAIEQGSIKAAPEAVFRSACIGLGGSRTFTGIRLPAGGSFLHRVVPDRRGFNVVMVINYPDLSRRVNRFGPGRTETFTVNTFSRVTGRVTITGVGGSFGCFLFSVTP